MEYIKITEVSYNNYGISAAGQVLNLDTKMLVYQTQRTPDYETGETIETGENKYYVSLKVGDFEHETFNVNDLIEKYIKGTKAIKIKRPRIKPAKAVKPFNYWTDIKGRE